ERNIVVILFILVIIIFSYAERDSRKLDHLYAPAKASYTPLQKEKNIAGNEDHKKSITLRIAKS
ncbi:MAG TPA: hypothetical protein VJ499_06590, partial [Flavisolibacter sp.]|nr:hypothetical protein [Flavisolibacter sp.]